MAGFNLTNLLPSTGFAPNQMESLAAYLSQFSQPQAAIGSPSAMIGAQPGTGTWNMIDGAVAPAAGGMDFGMNLDTGKLALSGLQTLGNLWGAIQSNNMAKDQFKLTKDIANTNLNNQIQTYNTSLTDRAMARAKVQGDDQSTVDQYLALNRLSR